MQAVIVMLYIDSGSLVVGFPHKGKSAYLHPANTIFMSAYIGNRSDM